MITARERWVVIYIYTQSNSDKTVTNLNLTTKYNAMRDPFVI